MPFSLTRGRFDRADAASTAHADPNTGYSRSRKITFTEVAAVVAVALIALALCSLQERVTQLLARRDAAREIDITLREHARLRRWLVPAILATGLVVSASRTRLDPTTFDVIDSVLSVALLAPLLSPTGKR
jgi:hypothetical protein